MKSVVKSALVAVISFVFSITFVFASDCPIVEPPEKLYPDDYACLDVLEGRFDFFTVDIEFLKERNALLSRFFYADQKLIIDTFFVKYCNLLTEARWNLTISERDQRLNEAREALYTKVPFPPLLFDSRIISSLPKSNALYLASVVEDENALALLFDDHANSGLHLAANEPETSTPYREYLKDPPFLVTRGNKHFVIVSSVRSYEDAASEVRRLKEKAPQFDFVVYAPYKNNPYYGIMMATWVRYSVAKEALENAKNYVAKDAYIWSCPGEGDSC